MILFQIEIVICNERNMSEFEQEYKFGMLDLILLLLVLYLILIEVQKKFTPKYIFYFLLLHAIAQFV